MVRVRWFGGDPVSALTDHILTLCNQAPTEAELTPPRRYRRRKTWVPVEGEKVTVWRMRSYDPDLDESFPGIFVSETSDFYFVRLSETVGVSVFEKKDRHGVSLWRMDSRGPSNQQLTESETKS